MRDSQRQPASGVSPHEMSSSWDDPSCRSPSRGSGSHRRHSAVDGEHRPTHRMHEILVHLGVETARLLPIVGRILIRITLIGAGSCLSLASTSALSREFVVDAEATPPMVFHILLVLMINISRGELTIRHLVWVITRLSSPTAGSALQLCFAMRLQRGRIHVMLDGLTHRLGMWIVLLRIGEARLLLVVVQVFHLNDVIRVGIAPPLVTTLVIDRSHVTREGLLLIHVGLQGTPLNDAMCGGITPRLPRSTVGMVLHGIIMLHPGLTVVRDLTTMEPVNGSLVVLHLVKMKL